MMDDRRASLTICLNDEEGVYGELGFVPFDTDVGGLWVQTDLKVTPFSANIKWFLATKEQHRLSGLYNDFLYGRACPEFVVRDTDCSLAATFRPDISLGIVNITVEIRHCLKHGKPAIAVDLTCATSSISDFQGLIQRIIQFR